MDCYKILGIARDANLKDINSAYKTLALKHHPDKTGGDDHAILQFQRIQQAVEILRDPIARKSHDKHLGPPPSEDERLFASPDYNGWVSTGLHVRDLTRSARYMYSYGNSVHMDPHSKESQEEKARWARAREEEDEMWRQRLQDLARRNAENRARLEAEAEERRARFEADVENRRPNLAPWSRSFRPSEGDIYEEDEEEDNIEAEWWAGAKPKEMKGAKSEADSGAVSDLAYDEERDVDIGVEPDHEIKNGNHADDGEDKGSANTYEAGNDLVSDGEVELDSHSDTKEGDPTTGLPADVDGHALPDSAKSSIKSTSDDGSVVIRFELGPEFHAEFDIEAIIAEAEGNAEDSTNVKPTVTEFDTKSPEKLTTEYHTASPGSPQDLSASPYVMSGGLGYPSPGSPIDAEKTFLTHAEYGSESSIYYDFSEPEAPSIPKDAENQILNPPPIPQSQTYNFKFNATNVYPHLTPFIPYFAAKLAYTDGRYTRDDFQTELRGMVMETYCGWVETVRATIPGAESREATLDLIPQDCLHLGYWEKVYGRDECEECHLWRPIYTLVCPGCGIRKCVGCKFDDAGA
ncbi:hypothetical protein ASPCAL07353 [Aspergillus calidoustus]|uniref:J domain-containing protein n=1 Tax=Aspergillus calidoustus TaxID=454130 RepID=A0A0U5G3I2_ASPCI|nr:hypothetical protein ASPCAL07353 [Aspergillus calidoustus]